jgi:large conductance mechanosensitive channel
MTLLNDFKKFLLRGNVVDLAVAVVIGAAFGAVVKALVADLLTPIIALIFGKPDFGALAFTINGSHFLYGDFINNLITFISIAAAVFFFVVKPVNYLLTARARRMAAGEEEDAATLTDEAVLLTEIRDLLKDRAAG